MIKELFIKSLGEKTFRENYSDIYRETVDEYEKDGVFFLSDAYIRSVNDETDAYPRILSLLREEAERIKENPSLAEYALFIHKAMLRRNLFLSDIKHFSLPCGYDFFAFLCLIPAIRNTYRHFLKMGIDADIIKATVGQFEECVFIYSKRFDRLGMNKRYFDWLQHYVDFEILNINRLRFEISILSEPVRVIRNKKSRNDTVLIEEGDFNCDGLYLDTPPKKALSFSAHFNDGKDFISAHSVTPNGKAESAPSLYSKTEYETVIKRGDTLLSVHIPDRGDFSRESCTESYRRAREIFNRFYPQLEVKGFVCYSWMMAPELKLHLKESSRVLAFAEHYIKFPIHTEGEDVLNFVFYLKSEDYEKLPENTSLQKSLKKLYVSGGRLYEYGGIFAIDKIE